ncbi:MAG: HNH endonuclease [Bacteroidales bacterium]|nr:HNH endonuclease [Candidatus Latescibacterota bacterium]
MARSRNIKPGLYKNEYLVELPFETRLMFAGLPCFADREGRLEDRPMKIKMEMFPADNLNVDEMLSALESKGFIQRYESDGIRYIQILNFIKHQNPHHKEIASCIPAPDGHKDSGAVPSEVTPGQRQRILDRDGHVCLSCGSTEALEIDHIVPVSKGGTSEDTNLQTLCGNCNATKGNRHTRSYNEPSTSRQRNKQSGQRPTCTRLKESVTSKEVKGIKKKARTSFLDELELPDFVDPKIWADFVQMRKEIKKKLTPTAVKQIFKDMAAWKAEGDDPNQSLLNSIRGSWQGVFQQKENNHGTTGQKRNSTGATPISTPASRGKEAAARLQANREALAADA